MKAYYDICRRIVGFLLKVLVKFKKCGLQHVPEDGGAIIASNHAAYIDPTLLGAALPRELYFLAKKELFRNKLFGWFIHKFNAVPISRGAFDRKGLQRSVRLLEEGKVLVLFPEGTRSKNGSLMEARPGIGKIALEAGVPVVPAYIQNSRKLARALFKGKGVGVTFGTPIEPAWFIGIPKNKDGYRLVGQEIMKRIGLLKENPETE